MTRARSSFLTQVVERVGRAHTVQCATSLRILVQTSQVIPLSHDTWASYCPRLHEQPGDWTPLPLARSTQTMGEVQRRCHQRISGASGGPELVLSAVLVVVLGAVQATNTAIGSTAINSTETKRRLAADSATFLRAAQWTNLIHFRMLTLISFQVPKGYRTGRNNAEGWRMFQRPLRGLPWTCTHVESVKPARLRESAPRGAADVQCTLGWRIKAWYPATKRQLSRASPTFVPPSDRRDAATS